MLRLGLGFRVRSCLGTTVVPTHAQPFTALDFVQDNLGEPLTDVTFNHSHLLWLSVIPYLLPPSIMIRGILPVQFTCLTVFFHNLSTSFLWSTSWSGTLNFILHTFLHAIIFFFLQHMPIPSQPVLLLYPDCHLIIFIITAFTSEKKFRQSCR